MLTANKAAGINPGTYVAQLDFLGPILFAPLHCSNITVRNIYTSPIIAYVKNDNPIQKKMVEDLDTHFRKLKTLVKLINDDPLVKAFILQEIKKFISDNAKDAEAALAAYESQINLLSGSDRELKRIGLPETEFYTKEFESKEALDSYISDD